jgi:hypothetical protein
LAGALACAAVVSVAGAVGGTPSQQYTGCLNPDGKLNQVAIGGAPEKACPKAATQISWNQCGPQGPPGDDGSSVTNTTVNVGDSSACNSLGGSKFQVGAGAATYACNGSNGTNGAAGKNGADGAAGAAGTSVTNTPLSSGNANCPTGGAQFQVGAGTPTYACNGAKGDMGNAGPPGSANITVDALNGAVGTVGPSSSAFVFVRPTQSLTLTATHQVTANLTTTWAVTSGVSQGRFDVCYQLTGAGSVNEFTNLGFLFVDVTTNRLADPVSATRSFTPGTYTIGYCAENAGTVTLIGDWLQGSLLVT